MIQEAVTLLQQLIATPSFSREESATAEVLAQWFWQKGTACHRWENNVWSVSPDFNPDKPTLLLNSHHDTVKPNPGYSRNPFDPTIEGDCLFGLGSNDAGGCLVSLVSCFAHFYGQSLPFNLVMAATAEEEISGKTGVEGLLASEAFAASFNVQNIDWSCWAGIVGEPTEMQMAVAERGLLVVDAVCTGKAGHAAREEGVNALYLALDDVDKIRRHHFEKDSELLGPVKMTVTSLETATHQHNVVPASCRYTIDIRLNEHYTHEEILHVLRQQLTATLTARSTRIRSTAIAPEHPLVQVGKTLGRLSYGSPTTSDKALIPFPCLKLGPGKSSRSHSADEFVCISEIEEGIDLYTQWLDRLKAAWTAGSTHWQ